MRGWLTRWSEKSVSLLPKRRPVDDLSLQLPVEDDETAAGRWLEELVNKLGALYSLSDQSELEFLESWKGALRAVSSLESRLGQLEKKLALSMAERSVPRGSHVLDLLSMVSDLSSVGYRQELGGYTLQSSVRSNRLAPDGVACGWCRLVRTLGRLQRAGDAQALLTAHPEEFQSWVTTVPDVPTAGDWVRYHTWVPSNYTLGELLYYELDSIAPFSANELVVIGSHHTRVLQYRYCPTVVRQNLISIPQVSQWNLRNANSVVWDQRTCASLTVSSAGSSSAWTSATLPAMPEGHSSRTVQLRIELVARQRSQLRVLITWYRSGAIVGYSSQEFQLTDTMCWSTVEGEFDEPGACDSFRVEMSVAGAAGDVLVHRADACFTMFHVNVDSGSSPAHVLPVRLDRPVTRFGFILNNQHHSVVGDSVQYVTRLSSVQLIRSSTPSEGWIQFSVLDSPDTIRKVDLFVSGRALGNSELLIDVPGESRVLRVPLSSSGGVCSVDFVEPRERAVSTPGGYVYTVASVEREDLFQGTDGDQVTLARMPWIWTGRVRELQSQLGHYDPNTPKVDAGWVARKIRAGDIDWFRWSLTADSDWQQVSGQWQHVGEWIECVTGLSESQIRWSVPAGWLPQKSIVSLELFLQGINPSDVQVRVNGETARAEWVDLRPDEPYPDLPRYRVVFDAFSATSISVVVGSNPSGKLIVSKRVVWAPRSGYIRPISVTARAFGLILNPAASREIASPERPTRILNERLALASETRIGEYQVWVQENRLSYQFGADRQIYMTRLYPILTQNGVAAIKVYELTVAGEKKPVPTSKLSLVPEFGLMTLDYQKANDSVFVADYVSSSADPSWRSYTPCTMNRTDYVNGAAPILRKPDWNPVSRGYYPVLEYYHQGRNVVFSTAISPLGDQPAELRVRYFYLPVRVRVRLRLRPEAGGAMPVVTSASVAVSTEAEMNRIGQG